MSFKQLSKIDKTTRFKVYGWIREAEKELKLNHTPTMISNICMLYVGDDDYFEIINNSVKASKNNKCLTQIKNKSAVCSYGHLAIPSKSNTFCQCDIKMSKLHASIDIGIRASAFDIKNLCL